jgi:hydrogenase-4 component F
MGIIVFGVGIGLPVGLYGALLHALNHAVTKALMFLIFDHISSQYWLRLGAAPDPGAAEARIHGVLKSMPVSGTILAFGGLALVGSPPFNIFMSEFIILWAALQKAFDQRSVWLFAAIFIFFISITLIFIGMARHLSRLLLGDAPVAPIEVEARGMGRLAPFMALIALILLFGLLIPASPVDFPALLESSVAILQNGVVP